MNDLSSQAFEVRNLIIELDLSYSRFPLASVRPHSPECVLGHRGTLLILSISCTGPWCFSNSEVTDITMNKIVKVFEDSTLNLTGLIFKFQSSKAMYETQKNNWCLRNPHVSLRVFSVGTLCSKCFYILCSCTEMSCSVFFPMWTCSSQPYLQFRKSFLPLCSLVKVIIKRQNGESSKILHNPQSW